MVAESKVKYQLVVFMFLAAFVVMIAGCGGDSAPKTIDEAISQAVLQLEIFGNSRTVSLWGHEEAVLQAGSSGKSKQQEIQTITEQQQTEFDQALENLKKFADEPVEDNRQAKTAAFAKWLVAAMELYRGQMAVDQVNLLEAREAGQIDQVLVSCLESGQLKAQQTNISPANYESAINQSQAVISGLTAAREVTEAQLTKVSAAIEGLEDELSQAKRQRDGLNVEIGKLASQMTTVPVKQAVAIQKRINQLEEKRFDVLVRIEKYEAGPLALATKYQVDVGDRKLTQVRGIAQLQEEQAFLTTRVRKVDEGIGAQETYLKNLQQQMAIAGQKGQQLATQLDEKDAQLTDELKGLDGLVSQRAALRSQAETALKAAVRYAQQSENDLKRYVSAVGQAASKVSGRVDSFLAGAKAVDDLTYSIGNIRVNAQLILAKLQSDEIDFVEQLSSVLGVCQPETSLPSNLAGVIEEAQGDLSAKATALAETVDSVVNKFESLYRSSARSDFKSIVGTQLGLTLYKASSLVPDKADEYLIRAKEVLGELTGEGPMTGEQADLVPARKLQQVLGL